MVNPVPGFSVSTAFHARGERWSCARKNGEGLHTGVDIEAPVGTTVVAARAGVAAHVNYSKKSGAFGLHQLAVRCSDGTEDFYAHMSSRIGDGTKVEAGDPIGTVGKEGNVSGPHLHLERHREQGFWSCENAIDPRPSLGTAAAAAVVAAAAGAQLRAAAPAKVVRLSRLRFGQRDSDSVRRLQRALNAHQVSGGQQLPVTGNYLDRTDEVVRLCQRQHGFGSDPPQKSFIDPRQAQHLFANAGLQIVD